MKPEELLEFQNEALGKLTEGAGFAGLAALLMQKVAQPVLVTNLFYKVVGSSTPVVQEGDILEVEGLNPGLSQCLLHLGGESLVSTIVPIQGTKKSGYLFILNVSAAEDTLLVAREMTGFCALAFSMADQIKHCNSEYKGSFVFDLLYGNMDDPSDLVERGKLWGWNLEKPHAVVVFQLAGYERFSADEEYIAILEDIVESVIVQFLNCPIVLSKQDQFISILPVERSSRREEKAFLKMFVNRVNGEVRQRLASRTVRVGIGRVYSCPGELFRSYQEAKVALELGYMSDQETGTPFFSELGLERLLYNHDQQELAEFFQEVMGDLEKLDTAVVDELLGTLDNYFVNHCDLKATANMLFVHPNTLRYRLKKIEKLLNLDLENFDTKLNLMTALKIRHLRRS